MNQAVANTHWARSFADELARAGVREVVVAPGSRSTPLVMAFAMDGRFRMRVHLDERSVGFFALGVGKASGRPAAVITTSGTAVANVFPAVVEAAQSGVPMLVLTADRPHRLRDSDANQAIDQVGIYGSFVRAFFDLAPPTPDGPALRHLRVVAGRAYAAAIGPDAGPVHLNFPFDKPLEPTESGSDLTREHRAARADDVPYTQIAIGRPTITSSQLEALVGMLDTDRGVIVAGPSEDAPRLGAAVRALALATGFPVLADPLSGARYGPTAGAQVVAGYDLFLRDEKVRERLTPTLIVRVGASPTSMALEGWTALHGGVPQLVVDGTGRWKDHGATASHYVQADPALTLERLAALASPGVRSSTGGNHSEWSESWRRAESAALSTIAQQWDGDRKAHEGQILSAVLGAMPPEAQLFVSGSMPIRDLDAFGHPRADALRVFANRGASGIDGILSSAFGVASQDDVPTVCVVGDVAFFHDQNGLLWSREVDAPVVFVLIDNDGGGIFHMLPIADREPHFTRFFATPHGIDLQHTASAHGLDFVEVPVREVDVELRRAIAEKRTQVLCVRTDRDENHLRHLEVQDAVQRSVRHALG